MKFKNSNIKIFIKDNWIEYDKMRKMVGGFHYSSAIRFYDIEEKYYFEIKSKDYSSVGFPFYYKSDVTKTYKNVFDSKLKILNKDHPFYIYEEYINYLKEIINIESITLIDNESINIKDLNVFN